MPPSDHALCGASGSHRWLVCTPSLRFEQKFPEPPSSVAAEEGTLAHAIAEEHLRQALRGHKEVTSKKHREHPLYRQAMEEYVPIYTDYVLEEYERAKASDPNTKIMLEQKVKYDKYAPGGFGTADCIIVSQGHLQIFDLKYGKGVPVTAVDNPQLKLYALGEMDDYGDIYLCDKVTTHIIQPRLGSITSFEIDADELERWGNEYVKPRALMAYAGEGEFCAGEHCRFCRGRHVCRAKAQKHIELAGLRLDDEGTERSPNELTPEEIATILDGVDALTRWAKGVKDYALGASLIGEQYPGYKLVRGRSNRVVTDEEEAAKRLIARGVPLSSIYKLRGFGELEEAVGKAALDEVLDGIIAKPEGKPVLVSNKDKRQAIDVAGLYTMSPIED